jgi:hypothetical protein
MRRQRRCHPEVRGAYVGRLATGIVRLTDARWETKRQDESGVEGDLSEKNRKAAQVTG